MLFLHWYDQGLPLRYLGFLRLVSFHFRRSSAMLKLTFSLSSFSLIGLHLLRRFYHAFCLLSLHILLAYLLISMLCSELVMGQLTHSVLDLDGFGTLLTLTTGQFGRADLKPRVAQLICLLSSSVRRAFELDIVSFLACPQIPE